jgi:hypothetical protein
MYQSLKQQILIRTVHVAYCTVQCSSLWYQRFENLVDFSEQALSARLSSGLPGGPVSVVTPHPLQIAS